MLFRSFESAIIIGPTFNKAYKVAAELVKSPLQGPPTELMALMSKGGKAALIDLVILLVAVAFMVASSFPL